MATTSDIRLGFYLVHSGEPYVVFATDFMKKAQSKGMLRTSIRNLLNGNVLKVTYRSGEQIEEADITHSKATYLYEDGTQFHFMDAKSYEQFFLPAASIGDQKDFLMENQEVDVVQFNGSPITIELPKKIVLEVIETEPAVRGDTAQGTVTKPAKMSTGAEVAVPLFVKTGDKIRINTETREYVERA
ncbi:MAG TPA: elongation factor P [Candidatus Kerfeldbacteria bacterium]|nr:MAG: Elongation factor P [Parcubacteria group bacterium GW2011_GWA2_48_9]KKW16539.1 MAG: Elongation factor P [Parcubacteria group bacterium GW2011_GWC2_49_9]HCJ52749.1 elongation factor P [Candidatus Kerfeldbacteria bacterium]HCM68757.1 elongation factor P [Candidatus Kerfeldbacteria bacterium]